MITDEKKLVYKLSYSLFYETIHILEIDKKRFPVQSRYYLLQRTRKNRVTPPRQFRFFGIAKVCS